jgi:predicted PurR-regulated permease PerM
VPRVVSLLVLLLVLLILGAVFFQVMAQFLVPLFLAAVLVVIFKPLHESLQAQLPGRPRLVALCTSAAILLLVFVPTLLLGWKAYVECRSLAQFTQSEEERRELIEAVQLRGGRVLAWYEKTFGTPLDAKKLLEQAARRTGGLVLAGFEALFSVLVGSAIMMIAVYYFLVDGPSMVQAMMRLSPLDNAYERELLEKFASVSRAVVLATVLSAVVQGLLAGAGYYFALAPGAPLILLTALTMVMAIVPFVGAAAVWATTAVVVFCYQPVVVDGVEVRGDAFHAIALALYGATVVSNADNVVKPWVLHGQSNLHPLLALLSVLGGVQVLGPIGILVGPMLVAFVQTLLNMLNKELQSIEAAQLTSNAR